MSDDNKFYGKYVRFVNRKFMKLLSKFKHEEILQILKNKPWALNDSEISFSKTDNKVGITMRYEKFKAIAEALGFTQKTYEQKE